MAKSIDRLSALIKRFRIDARVHPTIPGTCEIGPPDRNANLFIVESGGLALTGPGHVQTHCPAPALLYYPRGLPPGQKVHAHAEKMRLVCATVEVGGNRNPVTQALPERLLVSLEPNASLRAVSDLLMEEAHSPRCGGDAVMHRLCEVLIIRMLRHAIESEQAETGLLAGLAHPTLSRTIVAMHEHPDRKWSLEALADTAMMSRTRFAQTFRTVVGVTPGSYLSAWRLSVAETELAQGKRLKAVAPRVGYSSSAALSRAYSRRFGAAPTQRRNA